MVGGPGLYIWQGGAGLLTGLGMELSCACKEGELDAHGGGAGLIDRGGGQLACMYGWGSLGRGGPHGVVPRFVAHDVCSSWVSGSWPALHVVSYPWGLTSD